MNSSKYSKLLEFANDGFASIFTIREGIKMAKIAKLTKRNGALRIETKITRINAREPISDTNAMAAQKSEGNAVINRSREQGTTLACIATSHFLGSGHAWLTFGSPWVIKRNAIISKHKSAIQPNAALRALAARRLPSRLPQIIGDRSEHSSVRRKTMRKAPQTLTTGHAKAPIQVVKKSASGLRSR